MCVFASRLPNQIRSFVAAAVLPSLSAKPIAAVALVLNATTACQEVTSVFKTITVILSQNLYPNFVLVNKHHPYFFHERKRYLLTDCKRLYSSTTFKIFDSQNCK